MNELQMIKQQANLVIKAVEQIETVKEEIYSMKEEFQKDIDEIRSTYPLNRGEAILLSNLISNKAHQLTADYFGRYVSKELYGLKKVHLSNGMGHQLKKAFNSITYNTIRHLDYEDARRFINEFTLNDLPPHYLKLTEKQYEVAQNNGDEVTREFRGDYKDGIRLVTSHKKEVK